MPLSQILIYHSENPTVVYDFCFNTMKKQIAAEVDDKKHAIISITAQELVSKFDTFYQNKEQCAAIIIPGGHGYFCAVELDELKVTEKITSLIWNRQVAFWGSCGGAIATSARKVDLLPQWTTTKEERTECFNYTYEERVKKFFQPTEQLFNPSTICFPFYVPARAVRGKSLIDNPENTLAIEVKLHSKNEKLQDQKAHLLHCCGPCFIDLPEEANALAHYTTVGDIPLPNDHYHPSLHQPSYTEHGDRLLYEESKKPLNASQLPAATVLFPKEERSRTGARLFTGIHPEVTWRDTIEVGNKRLTQQLQDGETSRQLVMRDYLQELGLTLKPLTSTH